MPQRTNIRLIERATSEKWIRRLAFYHLVKYHYNNSCIYDYKSRMSEVAEMLGISTRTLYNYFNFLKSKELVREHDDNLVMKSVRDFEGRRKSQIIINEGYTISDISCLLYAKLIERKAHQQAFAESVRKFEKRGGKAGRSDEFNRMLCEDEFRPSFSYRSIAKIINSSEKKAFEVVKNLNRLGVIKSENQNPRKLSDNFTDLKSIADYPGYRYNIGTDLFEIFGAKIQFLQFPIFLKSISIKQYLKFNEE
jgi:hypothetical protein